MKDIFKVIIMVPMLSIILNAQTRWEEYISNPNNNENLKQLNSVEYTHENRIDRDIQVLAKRIISLDKNSIEVAIQLLLNPKSNFDGYLGPYIEESVSSIVTKNPSIYLDALANVGANQCVGISNLGEEFVDRFKEQAKEMRLRKKVLESLPNSHLKSLCINQLRISIKGVTRIIQENKVSKNKCLLEREKESIKNRLNEFYGDTVSFIQCRGDKTPLEEYVCKDDELLLMFKVLTQAEIYAYENATKTEENHRTYAKEYGLTKRTTERIEDSDWSIKSYRHNRKVNKKQLCYDLKINTNDLSGFQIYGDGDIARVNYTPKFTDYLIETTYTNPNKPLIQKNFGRLYRTLLKKALKEKKPEFAGKHIIAQWGCDDGKNECTTGGIIDASTGKATEFPFKYYAHNGSKEIIYKLNSSLIIFAGDFEFKDGRREKNKVFFYEFKDDEFLFLKATEYKK